MADIALGRKQLLSVLGAAASFLAFLAAAAWFGNDQGHVLRTFGPLIVFCALGGLAFRRVYWARGAIVVWLGLIAIFDGLRAILLVRRLPFVSLLVLAIAAGVACAAVFLYTSEHIEAFLLSSDAAPTPRSRTAT